MIAALKAWFDGRTLRERRMLLAMLAMIALTVIWFGVFLPISDGLSSSRTRLNDAVIRLGQAQAERDAIADLAKNRPQPIPGALADYLRQSAGDAGFALSDVEPQTDDRVKIAIPTARPGALFAWLADLEAAGVVVATIDVSNNGDQTVAAQILLMERGS
jgi:general secretion pathway protein M